MRIDDIEVEILINDRPAIEYSDNDFEQEPVEDEMSKYIEAVEGAKFAFRCTVHPSYEFAPAIDLLCFKFLVDGVRVMGKVVTKENISTGEPTTQMREGYITKLNGVASEEKFLFGKIKTCDNHITEAESDRLKKKFKDVGELRCEVWRPVGGEIHDSEVHLNKARDLSSIHQKAVSQIAVSIGMKKDAPLQYNPGSTYDGRNADNEPIATFIFKYRDRGLQRLRVIERSPTPIALEDRDPSTLTQDELMEAMRRIQAREKEQLAKIKKEKQETTLRQLAGSKRGTEEDDEDEPIAEVENPNKKARIEIVDLLDDD